MKKYLLIFVAFMVLIPINVKATNYSTDDCDTYDSDSKTCVINVCKDGCKFSNILNNPNFNNRVIRLIINLEKDEYLMDDIFFNYYNISNLTINGNGSTFFIEDENNNLLNIRGKNIELNNLTINNVVEFGYLQLVKLNSVIIKEYPNQDEVLTLLYPSGGVLIEKSVIPGIKFMLDHSMNITINNSDLRSENRCSIYYLIEPMPLKNGLRGVGNDVKFILSLPDPSIIITNSKLSCAACGTHRVEEAAIIEIDATNEWEDEIIVRGTNVLENTDNAYIYIEQSDEDTVTIDTTDDLNLGNYFEIDEDFPISWEVEDEEIATIEDNKIIPLKIGTTIIRGRQGHDIYTLRLDVTDEMINPQPSPTPSATPTVTPSPSPVPTNNVEVPDTYHTGLFIIIAAIFTVIPITYYFISKEEE